VPVEPLKLVCEVCDMFPGENIAMKSPGFHCGSGKLS